MYCTRPATHSKLFIVFSYSFADETHTGFLINSTSAIGSLSKLLKEAPSSCCSQSWNMNSSPS